MQSIRIRNEWLEFSVVLFLGLAVFWKKFGWFVVDPYGLDWLFIPGSDVNPDMLVWLYYYNSPLDWPLGMVEGYAYPFSISIIASSSLALFAVPAKWIGVLISAEPFQYFGFWLLICCILQGGFAWGILKKVGIKNPWIRVLGAGFFLLAPCFLDRRLHISLFGHWIVLWAFWLYLTADTRKRNYPIWWLLHGGVSILTHPYFIVFSLVVGAASLWRHFRIQRLLRIGIWWVAQTLVIGITLYACGYFRMDKGPSGAEGFGFYSANLNTFFNAQGRTNLPLDLPLFKGGQYEGLAYLGLGGILLCIGMLFALFFRPKLKGYFFDRVTEHRPLLIATILLFAYSLSNKLSFFGMSAEIPLPESVLEGLSIFRSSGRFIWFPFYVVMASLLAMYDREARTISFRYASLLIGFLLLLQLWDVWPQLKRDYKPGGYRASPLPNELIEPAVRNAGVVITFPPYSRNLDQGDDVMELLRVGAATRTPVTAGWFPRLEQVKSSWKDSIEQTIAEQHFDNFPEALWIVPAIEQYRFDLRSESDGFRMYYYGNYGYGFGPDVEIPKVFFSYPGVDTISTAFVHLADWLQRQSYDYMALSVRDDATTHLDQKVRRYFKDMGSAAIEQLGFRDSWAAVWGPKGLVAEQIQKGGTAVRMETEIQLDESTEKLELVSAGYNAGNISQIRIGKKDFSLNGRGLNVVLFDSSLEVIGKYHFDTFLSSYTKLKGPPQ